MKVLIDADGCPVVDVTVRIAKRHGIECLILCDTAHVFNKDGARTIYVGQGADSVDFALVNMAEKGDIVITQDYGLAAMCLAKQAVPVSQNGLVYTDSNIDSLLNQRYISKKIRMSGGRVKGNPKRKPAQGESFASILEKVMLEIAN